MFFAIDPANGIPIYDQIVRQVKFAVAGGHRPEGGPLQPGDLVPSVRELATQLAVNPNTVARAYRELQNDGVLATVRGTGLEITTSAPKRCRSDRLKLIRERLRSVLTEARQSRLEIDEIRALIDEELARLDKKGVLQ